MMFFVRDSLAKGGLDDSHIAGISRKLRVQPKFPDRHGRLPIEQSPKGSRY